MVASNTPGLLDGKSFGGQLSAGYLFNDTYEAGLSASRDSVNSSPENIDLTMFSVYGRLYGSDFGPVRPWFQLFVGTGTSETSLFQGDTDQIGFGLGFTRFLTEDWSLDVSADETFYHQLDGGQDNASLRIGVGFSYWM